MIKKISLLLVCGYIIMFLLGCSNKKTETNNNSDIEKTSVMVERNLSEAIGDEQKMEIDSGETEVKELEPIKNPLVLLNTYTFEPIQNVDIKSVSVELCENNTIKIFYSNELIIKIDDLECEINNVLNFCKPYNQGRLFSSSFHIFSNKEDYCGIISFEKGYVKVYKWSTDIKCPPFYSGTSNLFIMENVWLISESHYDYLTYKTVPAEFDGVVILVDLDSDEVVYFIDHKILHETVKLSIDKIQYEPDGFRIIIGNCNDSDEFVDFKLFTDNDNFRYEIYDKYSYSD